MKLELEINNTTQSPVLDGFFIAVIEKTFEELKCDFLKDKEVEISLALVAPEEIKKMNREYRQYDSVTDILSFPEYQSSEEIEKIALEGANGRLFLGELILCYDDINGYAKQEKLDMKKELAKVVAHGTLHLLGFEHGKKMFAIQDAVAKKVTKK